MKEARMMNVMMRWIFWHQRNVSMTVKCLDTFSLRYPMTESNRYNANERCGVVAWYQISLKQKESKATSLYQLK
jgi:hypothetical protein